MLLHYATMNADNTIVKIEDLSFSYRRHSVFKDVSISLKRNRIYGLLGENGVGKTTLMRIICGMLRPGSGSCKVNGMESSGRNPEMLKEIFYLPEIFVAPHIKVDSFARNNALLYPSFDREAFIRYCDTLEVERDRMFDKMSHGQQKKALIAFSLALNTRLLLMDEPSNGLDIPSKTTLRRLISESITEEKCILISTHQVRDLENIIDPIIILDRAGIILNADIETITSALKFTLTEKHNPEALFSEETISGYAEVLPNTDGVQSKVNLEALFNAALKNKETIKKLF